MFVLNSFKAVKLIPGCEYLNKVFTKSGVINIAAMPTILNLSVLPSDGSSNSGV